MEDFGYYGDEFMLGDCMDDWRSDMDAFDFVREAVEDLTYEDNLMEDIDDEEAEWMEQERIAERMAEQRAEDALYGFGGY